MKYKMIACDFDGTIFSHESFSVPENVKKAIRHYIDAGGKFVITTGRMYGSLIDELIKLDLHGDVLCMHGGVCYDIDTGKQLFDFDIPNSRAVELLRFIDSHGWISQIYHERDMLTQKENPFTTYYKDHYSARPIYTGIPLHEFLEKSGYDLHKAIVMSEPETIAEKIALLKANFPSFDVTQSMPEYIEIVDLTSGKGNAVKRLSSNYGLDVSEVAAFGDQSNDISMLKVAGFSACTSNSIQAVKDVVNLVAGDVEEGGLAPVIENLIADAYE
ncbi:MAG: HAD family phosphatase [Clostridia bacterium]|nr:HAD family phosphatase [Clostridia bacterium]